MKLGLLSTAIVTLLLACSGSDSTGAADAPPDRPATSDSGAPEDGSVTTPSDGALPAPDAGDAGDAAVDAGPTPNPIAWTIENPNFQAFDIGTIWGSGASDVWFGAATKPNADHGSAFRWNGSAFVTADSTPALSIWGSSATDVWSAGAAGLRHFDGVKWALAASVYASKMYGVSGSGPSDVWALDNDGNRGVSHFDGATWTRYTLSPGMLALTAVHAVAPNDVWVASEGHPTTFHHWNGATWTAVPSGVSDLGITGMWSKSSDDVWSVGDRGVLHWNGTEWENRTAAGAFGARGVWGAASDDVWTVGSDTIRHWNGTTWTSFDAGLGTPNALLYSVWGSSANDVWAGGKDGVIVHFDGTTWSPLPNKPRTNLYGGWASSETDAWAVGADGAILHSNGDTTWTAVASPTTSSLVGVNGTGANDVWAVGSDGAVVHWDGASWSNVDSGTTSKLSSVRARTASDVWAVGDEGTILHFDGTIWQATPSGTTSKLTSVWAAGGQLWAGGIGALLRWDGASWVADAKGAPQYTTAVSGSSATDAWAVGGTYLTINGKTFLNANKCTALHWDGALWSAAAAGPSSACMSVWAEQPGGMWAIGLDGEVTLTTATSPLARVKTTGGIQKLFGHGARTWALGAQGTILRLR